MPIISEYPLDWGEILDEYTDEQQLDLYNKDVEEQGEEIHQWLEDELGDYRELEFEQVTSWENPETGEQEWGRYDASDGTFIYEFKSKPHTWFLNDHGPHRDEVEQLANYLEGEDLRYGVLVYIDRENLDVEEYLVDREQI